VRFNPSTTKFTARNTLTKSKLITIVLTLGLHTVAFSGYHQGLAAYQAANYARALKEWVPLANKGNAEAQFGLGSMYDDGEGVKQDFKQALVWYRKAAEQGNASAQENMGMMYGQGQGVSKNIVAAYALFSVSAANDEASDDAALESSKELATKMTAKEINAAKKIIQEMSKPENFLKALDKYVKQAG